MSATTTYPINDPAWLAQFVGRTCRCGCNRVATHLMIGTDMGKPFPLEPCCLTVGDYCEECAEGTGDEHLLVKLPK